MMYFTKSSISELYVSVSSLSNSFSETVSLCHKCYSHVPALRYEKNGKIYMAKNCKYHGITYHLIENDSNFYNQLKYVCDPSIDVGFYNNTIMFDVTDRCNLSCPHCYHIPNNKSPDRSKKSILEEIGRCKKNYPEFDVVVLTGAEAPVRRDFFQLVSDIRSMGLFCSVMTNGVKFANKDFLKSCINAGLNDCNIGLNHPTYNCLKVRRKQNKAIENIKDENFSFGYVSYTMNRLEELSDILEEITNFTCKVRTFRVRYGSDIGTNPGQERLFLSDLYKNVKAWCEHNDKNVEVINPCDNNIYHIMIKIDDKIIRLIQWCDVTDIDMENLKSGPWSNFVGDGITNFLHQIIRRDIKYNQNITLPDLPPKRYLFKFTPDYKKLDLNSLF